MRFPVTSAQLNLSEKPAAVVRPSEVKSAEWYEQKLRQCDHDYDQYLDEYKESGAWKHKYKTWAACCELVFQKTQQAIDKRIKKHRTTTEVVESPDSTQQQDKQSTLNKVSELDQPMELPKWAKKVIGLLEKVPRSRLYNRLKPESIKAFEDAQASLYSVLGECLPQKPAKIMCRCGCGMSAEVSEILAKVGVPCNGLTVGQAGLVMGKLAKNEWKLPRAFEFLRNKGEWIERQFKGKPQPKSSGS